MDIGKTTYGTLSVDDNQRRRHIYISGKTGTGKSTLLRSFMLDDLKNNRPFALLDPHGDLAISIADACPHNAIYLDPQDRTHAVGFNPIKHVPIPERSKYADHIVATFRHKWADTWGSRMEYILMNFIRLMLDNDCTLLDLPSLLTNKTKRERFLRRSTDPYVSAFFTDEFDEYTDRLRIEAISPIQNKVGKFVINSYLRNIIGQPSTINPERIMDKGHYLICNLSKTMGETPSHLLGAFLSTAFAQAAEARNAIPEEERKDFTLYVDEFQNFATDSFVSILSEARKYRLNLVLANQFVSQLPDHLRDGVFGNAGTLIVFAVGAKDAELLAKELGHPNATTLTNTENGSAWVKNGGLNLVNMPIPLPPTGNFSRVISFTRAFHARPIRPDELSHFKRT